MVIYYIFIFIFGTLFGSFLNCLIYRLEIGKRPTGNSFCPKCKHQLSVLDLVPIFSYLLLRGKCRYCGEKISIQYPLVEIFTGLFFLIGFVSYPIQLTVLSVLGFAFLLVIFLLLIVIFVYDLKHYIIPNKIIYPALLFAVFYQFIANGLNFNTNFLIALLSGLIAFLFFLSIYLITKGKGIGFGDVRYAGFMGVFLSFPSILAGLFLSFFIGAIIGIVLIISKEKSRKDMVPFGPFLVLGTFLAYFFGEILIEWYLLAL